MRSSRPAGSGSLAHLVAMICLSSACRSKAWKHSMHRRGGRGRAGAARSGISPSRNSSQALLERLVRQSFHGAQVLLVGGSRLVGGEAVGLGVLVQRLLHRLSSPVQAGHHGTDRNVEHLGDLLVGESLHVGEQHGQAERLGQVVERLLDVVVGDQVEELVLGRPAGHRPTRSRRCGGTGRGPRRRRGRSPAAAAGAAR